MYNKEYTGSRPFDLFYRTKKFNDFVKNKKTNKKLHIMKDSIKIITINTKKRVSSLSRGFSFLNKEGLKYHTQSPTVCLTLSDNSVSFSQLKVCYKFGYLFTVNYFYKYK